MMKYGIYYAYWAKEWGGDFLPYIEKVKKLGFDVLEVACGAFHLDSDETFRELRRASEYHGLLLSGGYGPRPEHNLASTDEAAVERTLAFYADVFRKMELAGIDRIGGALYSYWPVDFASGFDKAADTERSIKNMRRLADLAADPLRLLLRPRLLAEQDRGDALAELLAGAVAVERQRARGLALHADVHRRIGERDAGRGLVDLLPARTGAADERLDEVLLADAEREHPRGEAGLLLRGGRGGVHFAPFPAPPAAGPGARCSVV